MSEEPLYTEICRSNDADQTEPRTQTRTLCEPAQSKCMSKFQKNHFIRKFTNQMPQTRPSPERRHALCASLRSRNACQNFRRATLYRNLQVKCRRPDRAQNADTHTVCEPAQSKCMSTFHKSHFRRKFTGKMSRPRVSPERRHTHTHTLCEPAQSKCMSTFQKSRFTRKFTGQMPQTRTRMSPERRHTVWRKNNGRLCFCLAWYICAGCLFESFLEPVDSGSDCLALIIVSSLACLLYPFVTSAMFPKCFLLLLLAMFAFDIVTTLTLW